MAKIIMDDDESQLYQFSDEEDLKHGEGYNLNETRGKLIKLKPERAEKIKAEFDCVVVHDFGDEYHLSEEERIAKNKFYEAFKVFNKCKHKYRRLDEYVSAMREALKCLDFVASNNGVYPPDKFKKLFFQKKIYINGLIFPQFKGRERKTISWDYLTEFILSDLPAEEINPKHDEKIYSNDELVDLESVLFEKEELEFIFSEETSLEKYKKELYFDRDVDEQEGNVVVFLSDKDSRKMIKNQPEMLNEIKEMKRESNRRNKTNMARYIYDLTSDDIDAIAEYDQKHGYKSSSDMPEFHGDMTNDSDYNRYLAELEEWEKSNIKEIYAGKLKSIDEIELLNLKELLERNNWNIRNLYDNKEQEEKLKKIKKKEDKREKELKRKLIDLHKRQERRMGVDVDSAKKKSKKCKQKKNKDNKKRSKEVKRYTKEASEAIDDVLLGSVDQMGNWKDYKADVSDWSWDSITKGGK